MSRWLLATALRLSLILSLALSLSWGPMHAALAAPTSLGPTSAEEAEILWKDGRSAFQKKKYQDAINLLQRLIDRYPGHPGYLESHKLMGEACIRNGDPERGLPYLRHYVEGTRNPTEIAQGGLALGEAYLALKKFTEAFLIAEGFEKGEGPYSLKKTLENQPILQGRTLLLKSRALIGLDQDERALAAWDSASKVLKPLKSLKSLKSDETFEVRLILKTRSCDRFPSAGPLDEAQVKDQLLRRSTCLKEALLLYRDHITSTDSPSAKNASAIILDSFAGLVHACKEPPMPPRLTPKERTPEQLKRYREELSAALRADCRRALEESADLVLKFRSKQFARSLTRLADEAFPRLAQ